MTQVIEKQSAQVSNFLRMSTQSTNGGPSWVNEMRRQGIARFDRVGFPNTKQEEWRQTNVAPIAKTVFKLGESVPTDEATEFSFGKDAACELIFVNGHFSPELSKLGQLPRGVTVRPLASAISGNSEVKDSLSRLANIDANPFVALNTGFIHDGAYVHLARNTTLAGPIHLLFFSTASDEPTVSHPRVLVIAEDNVEAQIVESYVGTSGKYFTNAVTEIVLGNDCRIDHCKLQQESRDAFHVATMEVTLGRATTFVSHAASIGAKLSRNDLNCHMFGEGAYATLNGVVLIKDEQHCDNHTLLDHASPNCPSHELYKHVLSDKSTAVFRGKILVRQPAQKTDSKQTSKSLLLSDDAYMNSQPALEIYADDVKCTHGSTTGPVDEDMVFYLRTRGVGLEAARHLLTYAFAADITRRMRVEPVRRRIEDYMATQHGLPQDLRITDLGTFDEKRGSTGILPVDVLKETRVRRPCYNPFPMSSVLSNPVPSSRTTGRDFDVHAIRAQFPILKQQFHGKPLVYLDNGATTQKPQSVIDTINRYYTQQNSNIHRGVYELSQIATDLYEEARIKIQRFINAKQSREIIFTRGTSEGINLVAASLGRSRLKAGDEVIISAMEHHSNIVPWQIVCEQTGAKLRVIPMNDRGELLLDEYEKMLNERTKVVSFVHLSNSLGTINPAKEMIRTARQKSGACVMIDGAQWVAHFPTDVQDLDVDFYAFSGHKLFGPTGIGVLYGKAALLESMPPYQGGGDMIKSVTFEKTTYADLPNKFEAGTPHVEGGIGLGAAIDWVQSVGLEKMAAYEHDLLEYAQAKLGEVPGFRLIGSARNKASVISFVLDNPSFHPYDVGVALDMDGIAVRTGHHCCQPVMDRMHVSATARASLAAYNTREDIDALVASLKRLTAGSRPQQTAPAAPAVGAMASQEVIYPPAAGRTPQAAADELAEIFDLLGERDEKNRYVLDDLGAHLPHYFDLLKSVSERVQGCVSEVYLVGRRSKSDAHVLEFVADSDANIVRGLIALMQKLFSGQRADQILAFDIEGFFRRIGLDQFISQQRRNGLAGMANRIRALAQEIGKT